MSIVVANIAALIDKANWRNIVSLAQGIKKASLRIIQ
jgi:hypothetical protein